MRNNKYRAQAFDGTWVYGSLLQDENGKCVIIPTDYDAYTHDGALCIMTWTEVKPETVMAYSGRTCKGREIYSGDVLEEDDFHMRVVVFWEEERLKWSLRQIGTEQTYSLGALTQKQIDWYSIIGNIIDNPELNKEA